MEEPRTFKVLFNAHYLRHLDHYQYNYLAIKEFLKHLQSKFAFLKTVKRFQASK